MTENSTNYEGCNFIRQRLILATLSGKTVRIKNIRSKDTNPGLRDFEASLIRLIDKITNGSTIVVNETGTGLLYQPGLLIGGSVDHECNAGRAIGYYLETLLCLAPFMKNPLQATLRGTTNDQMDPSVDFIKMSMMPMAKRFLGTDEGLDLKIKRRAAAPDSSGEVVFSCPCRQKLRPINYLNPGKVKRIRGVAWTVRISPTTANRVIESTRGVLTTCVPDVYIYADPCRGKQAGQLPGFGLTLCAETINGTFYCAEMASNPKGSDSAPTVPEDLGTEVATLLLEEIYSGGCMDTVSQGMTFLMMVLGQQDVNKIQSGPLTPYSIQFLRHIRDFFQVTFKIDSEYLADDDDSAIGAEKLKMTCVGVGYSNISKPTT